MEENVKIHTSSVFYGNEFRTGNGGCGVICATPGFTWHLAQGFRETTPDRLALMGIIAGLKKLPAGSYVSLYTDSDSVVAAIEGWPNADRQYSALNEDLWQELRKLMMQHHIAWEWVEPSAYGVQDDQAYTLARDAAVNGPFVQDTYYS